LHLARAIIPKLMSPAKGTPNTKVTNAGVSAQLEVTPTATGSDGAFSQNR